MKNLKNIFSLLIFLITKQVVCIDYDGWLNIKLQHMINCENANTYCSRGSISLKSIRSGSPIIDQITFTKDHIQALKELAQDDNFYIVRILVTSSDVKDMEFISSIKAQAYLDNGLSDVINTWMNHNGAVAAINFQVANSTSAYDYESQPEYELNSNFFLRHVEQAPVPDTASYIQKLEREREAREKGELKDNRSFLAKYWMYIVPVAIFLMISGAASPEPAQAAR